MLKLSISSLREHLDSQSSDQDILDKLDRIGLEVDDVIDPMASLNSFIVAEITQAEKHPNADSLRVCKVFDGTNELDIVCGASNARQGLKTILAPVGSTIPANGMVIKKSKIRQCTSNGMLCAAEELCLENNPQFQSTTDGIIEINNNIPNGTKLTDLMNGASKIIKVAVTPNRGDCLSVMGLARDP